LFPKETLISGPLAGSFWSHYQFAAPYIPGPGDSAPLPFYQDWQKVFRSRFKIFLIKSVGSGNWIIEGYFFGFTLLSFLQIAPCHPKILSPLDWAGRTRI